MMETKIWTCQDIMSDTLVYCTVDETVKSVAKKMRESDIGSLPVVESQDNSKLVGMVTDRDLATRVVAHAMDNETTHVARVMTPNPITCHPNDPVVTVMQRMAHEQVRRIPVVNDIGEVVGIVAQADIARHLDSRTTGEVVEEISKA